MKKIAKRTVLVAALLALFFTAVSSSFASETAYRRGYYRPARPVYQVEHPAPYYVPARPYYRGYVPAPALRPVRPLVRPWIGVYF